MPDEVGAPLPARLILSSADCRDDCSSTSGMRLISSESSWNAVWAEDGETTDNQYHIIDEYNA